MFLKKRAERGLGREGGLFPFAPLFTSNGNEVFGPPDGPQKAAGWGLWAGPFRLLYPKKRPPFFLRGGKSSILERLKGKTKHSATQGRYGAPPPR